MDTDDEGANGDREGGLRHGDTDGAHGEDDMEDTEGEDSMDDDMMDRISSSPSIDNGGYCKPSWPAREDSLSSPQLLPECVAQPELPAFPSHFLLRSPSAPAQAFLPGASQIKDIPDSEDHHYKGEYAKATENCHNGRPAEDSFDSEIRDQLAPLISESRVGFFGDAMQDAYDSDFEDAELVGLLLPLNDPLLDNSFDDEALCLPESSSVRLSPCSGPSWNGPTPGGIDDDTEELSFVEPRFVDSGWGGECLREIEDIDFEFVYALHTFVATVEGQANATKGDTMVLLDDSNSYWWLVRVVKDSSIGNGISTSG